MGFEEWIYGLDGERITEEQFAALTEQHERIQLGREEVGDYLVVTVWNGVSATHPPMIFETVVWHDGEQVEIHRYPTRGLALLGHRKTVWYYRRFIAHNG